MVRVGGIILCGGASRRMGQSKAELDWNGEPMLVRVVRVVSEVVSPVVVAHYAGQSLPPLPADVRRVADPVSGVGPLGGLLGGLTALADSCDAAFVCACDQPLLRAAFVTRLVESLCDRQAVMVSHGDRLHVLTAVYRTEVVGLLRQQIDDGDLRVRAFAKRCAPVVLMPDAFHDVDPALESLRNINTPQDVRDALRLR